MYVHVVLIYHTAEVSGWGMLDFIITLYTVDATKFVTAQIDATFHEGRGKLRTVS